MTISAQDDLPAATLLYMGPAGLERVALQTRANGVKLVIFGVPGAFTRTCTSAHVPSFIRTKGAFLAKGVAEVICVSVNDPFVMKAWGDATGASEAGITMMADSDASLAKALGLVFSAPDVGLIDRCQRFALYAEDGVVKVVHVEDDAGVCETSGGEALLAAI